MRIIDAHVHVWSDDNLQWPLAAGFQRSHVRPPRFSIEDLLGHMHANKVDQAVLVQIAFYGYDNGYLFDNLNRYPGRFAGITLIDQHSPRIRETMLEHKAAGSRGFRIYPRERPAPDWLNTDPLREMFRTAAEEQLLVCCLINPDALDSLARMCTEFVDTPVVIDHMCRIGINGQVDSADIDALCAMARFPKVYVKISAFYALGKRQAPYDELIPMIKRLSAAFGAARLMWASDAPYQADNGHHYADSLALVKERLGFLTPADRALILGETACRLFFR